MEYVSDVAGIFVPVICCPTPKENLDEYYLAWIGEYQFINFYYSGSNRLEFLCRIWPNLRPRLDFSFHAMFEIIIVSINFGESVIFPFSCI